MPRIKNVMVNRQSKKFYLILSDEGFFIFLLLLSQPKLFQIKIEIKNCSVVMTFDFSRLKSNDAKVESRIRQKHKKSNEIRLFHIQRKKN